MGFNAPPNWPASPAGWTPPDGWQPDPSWPPAPEGWQFWVDDTPPRNRRKVVVAALVGLALAMVAVSVGLNLLFNSDEPAAAASAPTSTAKSTTAKPTSRDDEPQIRAVVSMIEVARNSANSTLFNRQICAAANMHLTDAEMKAANASNGWATIEVGTVTVRGNAASAVITTTTTDRVNVETVQFIKEDGFWLLCQFKTD